jgi:hypothetical protein
MGNRAVREPVVDPYVYAPYGGEYGAGYGPEYGADYLGTVNRHPKRNRNRKRYRNRNQYYGGGQRRQRYY